MNDRPTITQAMIDAYDEYTHLTLDRRRFMEKLSKLAGSGTAAAAILPLISANAARAAIVAADDTRLKTMDVTYNGASGEVKGYVALPSDANKKLPAVIVIHENRGLNDHIKDVTRRVALEGFVALAPDLLSTAGGTPADEDKARDMIAKLDPQKTRAEELGTVSYLKGHEFSTGKIGAVGFCWGGGAVNDLAVASPDLSAGVAYYGRQPKAEDVPKISAALMLHYAGLDERTNVGIDAYKDALTKAGKNFQIFVYEGANHAFNNDTSEARYNKQAAGLAWSRTIAFLKEQLAG